MIGIEHPELFDAAVVAAVGAVVAAGVSAMAVVAGHRASTGIRENRKLIVPSLESVMDMQYQQAQRQEEHEAIGHDVKDVLEQVRALQREQNSSVDQFGQRLLVMEEQLAQHIERSEQILAETAPLTEFVRELMGRKEEG